MDVCGMNRLFFSTHSFTSLLAALVLATLMASGTALAAPPDGKGGKGKGGTDSGAQPELHLKWRVQLPGSHSLVRPAVAVDGTVYAVDAFDHLFAVAPDGTVLWSAAGAGSKGVDVGPDGTIYTGNEDWINAFNPDGSLKWTFEQTPRAFICQDIAVGPDGHVYVIAASGMGVFSLADTPAGPVVRWQNPEPYNRQIVSYTELGFGPTADGTDQQLYFYANGHTRSIRLSDGASIFAVGGGNTPPRVSAFDGSWHRGATAWTPNAELLWEFTDIPLHTGLSEPSLANDGTHYAINGGNVLYAIDPFGIEERHFQLDEFVGIPDVNPAETQVLLPTNSTFSFPQAIKAVSAGNGAELWRMELPLDPGGLNHFVDSAAAFSPDGNTAYVMSSVAGTGAHTFLNAIDTAPSLPNASTLLRSVELTMTGRSRRGGVSFSGIVTVQDQNRAPISGASISATWTLPDGSTVDQTASSGGSGGARFSVAGFGGQYTLEVTDISKDGYTYDARHSIRSDSRIIF